MSTETHITLAPPAVSIREIEELAGGLVKMPTIFGAMERGEIPIFKKGGRRYALLPDVVVWLASRDPKDGATGVRPRQKTRAR
jgi:hypothetical protein